MMDDKTKGLFSITQAAAACGISRSTLMRMEEKGMLTPACISESSGWRYYDNHNITRILQIQKFQSMGFNAQEASDYFTQGGEAAGLLSILENKLSLLQRNVEELRIRAITSPEMSVQMITLPETVCCTRKYPPLTAQGKYDAAYQFFHECVTNGYVLAQEPLFFVYERTDYLEGRISSESNPLHVCVPIQPEKAPENAVRFPSCKVLSVLFYGDYKRTGEAWLRLGREAKERGLCPASWPRGIGIVAPYTGKEIDPGKYCTRVVMPVAEN